MTRTVVLSLLVALGTSGLIAVGSLGKVSSGDETQVARIAQGALWPKRRANVSSTMAARVTRVLVATGQQVKVGQPVIQLDATRALADLSRKTLAMERSQVQARMGVENHGSEQTRLRAIELAESRYEILVRYIERLQESSIKSGLVSLRMRRIVI